MPYRSPPRAIAPVTLIGVDCAVDPRRVGLALGRIDERGRTVVWEAQLGDAATPPALVIRGWLERAGPALLALDAPLGWPVGLGRALAKHVAGDPIAIEANALARRITDDFVATRIGKRPLDVGADRIARTAHAALALLDQLRSFTRRIPLAWTPRDVRGVAAIEVYPAATLRARAIDVAGARAPEGLPARRKIVSALRADASVDLGNALAHKMAESDHVLDAVVCVLAAADFVRGDVLPPEGDAEQIRREGWIWVRPPAR